jgi:nicotinate (nicotinamide) nucleotide adenylyltransferase
MVALMKSFRGRGVLGVFGGSFDPPHLGHAMLPTYLRLRGLVDRVLVAPCADHPFGKPMRPFVDRLAWTRVAMEPHGDFVEVSAIEADLAMRKDGPSYTLRLLEAVAAAEPDWDVRLVVGSDIVDSGETQRWHRWDRIVEAFSPIVVPRAGHAPAEQCVLPEVSSTAVREALAQSQWDTLASWVPAQVLARLREPVLGTVWIVGQGNVAAHAGPWLRALGWSVVPLAGRSVTGSLREDLAEPDAVWVLVSDPSITEVAERLADSGRLPSQVPVLHGAGAALAREALAPLADAGHPVGTLHPICSLRAELVWPSNLSRAGFGIEGDPAARAVALRFVQGHPWLDLQTLDAGGRLAYHGACALAANHLSVLMDAAARALTDQGHPDDAVQASLAVLLESSLSNLVALGIPKGITGPVARGDTQTVQRHLEALPEPAKTLYRELSDRLVKLVAEAST